MQTESGSKMIEFAIENLLSGGIVTNYFCASKCGHCLYRCGPGREKKYISPVMAEKVFRTVRSLGCRSVHIGGGEPLLRPDELESVLDMANRTGVNVEYAETNSAWFRDAESATALLKKLKKKGLRTLLVSISPFHNEFIPFSKVKGVMNACERSGIGIFPWVSDFIPEISAFDHETVHSLDEYMEKFGGDYLAGIPGRYWIHMGGRATDTFRPVFPKRSLERIMDENPGGCARELSNTSHFHIDLYGNYIPGLCAGLSIRMDDLGKPIPKERYPVLDALFHSGIRGLLRLARDEYGCEPEGEGYVDKCDACSRIRTFLSGRIDESPELNPSEFYES